MLASASYDKTVIVWDVLTGKKVDTLTYHTDWVNSVAFRTSMGRSWPAGAGTRR